jgi:hypothetical protein
VSRSSGSQQSKHWTKLTNWFLSSPARVLARDSNVFSVGKGTTPFHCLDQVISSGREERVILGNAASGTYRLHSSSSWFSYSFSEIRKAADQGGRSLLQDGKRYSASQIRDYRRGRDFRLREGLRPSVRGVSLKNWDYKNENREITYQEPYSPDIYKISPFHIKNDLGCSIRHRHSFPAMYVSDACLP